MAAEQRVDLIVGVECTTDGVRASLVEFTGAANAGDGEGVQSRRLASAALPVSSGSMGRVSEVLQALLAAEPLTARAHAVTIATTECEDALQHARGLARTGCVRLVPRVEEASPGLREPEVQALADWPPRLRAAVGGIQRVLPGGCHFDGRRRGVVDRSVLADLAAELRADEVEAVAVTGTFAPVDPSIETEVADALGELLPGIPVSVSQPLGSIGLLARENAAILNAALLPLAAALTARLQREVRAVLPRAGVHLTRVDGTVMEPPFAARRPALTLGSVAASRLRGAARLAGHDDCLVFVHEEPDEPDEPDEIGRGSAAHLFVVLDGEPVHSPQDLVIAGVRTSLPNLDSMPIDEPIGLRDNPWAPRPSPPTRSGGHFDLPRVLLGAPIPHLGATPLPDGAEAGAVGAAGAAIAGNVDRIVAAGRARDPAVLEKARHDARLHAILAGASEEAGWVVTEESESPLAYVPGDLVRLRVTVSGRLPRTHP